MTSNIWRNDLPLGLFETPTKYDQRNNENGGNYSCRALRVERNPQGVEFEFVHRIALHSDKDHLKSRLDVKGVLENARPPSRCKRNNAWLSANSLLGF